MKAFDANEFAGGMLAYDTNVLQANQPADFRQLSKLRRPLPPLTSNQVKLLDAKHWGAGTGCDPGAGR